eukprot:TRINITY_DN5418_c0_g2_i1.p1 TRINITY_DN5418_c0_g2~~TRINITY_DN5418_c0_g2_i1.p1  ORF type:complete len:196 (+),score=15.36 TRINITY_DN5418_c0_g2_i1:100-687(+)
MQKAISLLKINKLSQSLQCVLVKAWHQIVLAALEAPNNIPIKDTFAECTFIKLKCPLYRAILRRIYKQRPNYFLRGKFYEFDSIMDDDTLDIDFAFFCQHFLTLTNFQEHEPDAEQKLRIICHGLLMLDVASLKPEKDERLTTLSEDEEEWSGGMSAKELPPELMQRSNQRRDTTYVNRALDGRAIPRSNALLSV